MNPSKRKKLESAGWRVGSTAEFLALNEQEAAYIELKRTLGESLKQRRLRQNLTQVQLAKLIKSNQSRVAKMETGHPSVSIDLLVKSLLALGTTPKDLGTIIAEGR